MHSHVLKLLHIMYFIVYYYYYSDLQRTGEVVKDENKKKVSNIAIAKKIAKTYYKSSYFSYEVELWQFFKNDPPKQINF